MVPIELVLGIKNIPVRNVSMSEGLQMLGLSTPAGSTKKHGHGRKLSFLSQDLNKSKGWPIYFFKI